MLAQRKLSGAHEEPRIVPSDEYPPSLRRLAELKAKLPHLVFKDFGPGHHFLAEENPERVAALLSEWMDEAGLCDQNRAPARRDRAPMVTTPHPGEESPDHA